MKRLIASMLFLLVLVQPSSPQKGYQNGYILTHHGDTILGIVNDRKVSTLHSVIYERIRFKPSKSRLFAKKYDASEITGYGYADTHFRSLPFTSEGSFFKTVNYASGDPVFLKVRSDSYLSLYQSEYVDEDGYITSSLFLKRKDESTYTFVPPIGFRKKMLEYFSDAVVIQQQIQSREYRLRDIEEIGQAYNDLKGQ